MSFPIEGVFDYDAWLNQTIAKKLNPGEALAAVRTLTQGSSVPAKAWVLERFGSKLQNVDELQSFLLNAVVAPPTPSSALKESVSTSLSFDSLSGVEHEAAKDLFKHAVPEEEAKDAPSAHPVSTSPPTSTDALLQELIREVRQQGARLAAVEKGKDVPSGVATKQTSRAALLQEDLQAKLADRHIDKQAAEALSAAHRHLSSTMVGSYPMTDFMSLSPDLLPEVLGGRTSIAAEEIRKARKHKRFATVLEWAAAVKKNISGLHDQVAAHIRAGDGVAALEALQQAQDLSAISHAVWGINERFGWEPALDSWDNALTWVHDEAVQTTSMAVLLMEHAASVAWQSLPPRRGARVGARGSQAKGSQRKPRPAAAADSADDKSQSRPQHKGSKPA